MREARIVCLTNQYRIRDLKLDLVKGQVKFLSEKDALGSLDLQGAKLAGVIEFQWVERSKEIRPPQQVPPEALRKKLPPPPASPVVNQRVLQDLVSKSVKAQMAELRQAIVGDIQEALSQLSVAAPANSPPGRGTVASGRGVQQEEEIPLFIPNSIFKGTAKAEIHVEAETSEDDGLDEAQEALRALRKGKREDDMET